MYCNGQTLRHKETNELARLDPTPDTSWAWDIGSKTAFIGEKGNKFLDDIKNYTHIEDELGRPYASLPKKGQFVDESAKKYLASSEKLAEMRQERLETWEEELLDRMSGKVVKMHSYLSGKEGVRKEVPMDDSGKYVSCPFADGGRSDLFRDYFLSRRGAVPLYRKWDDIKKEFVDGPRVFRHIDGQLWLYSLPREDLTVIEEGSIPNL